MRGLLATEAGDLSIAIQCQHRAIDVCEVPAVTSSADRPLGLHAELLPSRELDLVVSLNNLAMVQLCAGSATGALKAIERAMDSLAQVDESSRAGLLTTLLHTHGSTRLALGCVAKARKVFLQALSIAVETQNHQLAVAPLEGLACTATSEGWHLLAAARRAALIAGAADHRKVTPNGEAERISRAALGKEPADEAWNQGLQLDLEAARAFVGAREDDSAQGPLAPRKMQIARLVAEGLTDKEIASNLLISKRTVETHLLQLRQQLGFHNRAQVAAWAVSRGLTAEY